MQVSCKSKRKTYTQWKWPEKELECKERHCV